MSKRQSRKPAKRKPAKRNRFQLTRESHRGFDPVSQGARTFVSAIPTFKGVNGSRQQYATTHAEQVAVLVAELTPGIATFGRGDVSDDAAERLGITGPDGPRLPIAYPFEGKAHTYLPDLAGTVTGDPAARTIIEAGRLAVKVREQELAKLRAAEAHASDTGGELLIVCPELVPKQWARRALFFHAARFEHHLDPALLEAIHQTWRARRRSIRQLIEELSDRASPDHVIAGANKVAGDLLAEGRLDLDLAVILPDLDTPIRAVPDGSALRLPPGVIHGVEQMLRVAAEASAETIAVEDDQDEDTSDAVIDETLIEDPQERAMLLCRREWWLEVQRGVPAATAGRNHGLEKRHAQLLVKNRTKHGELAFIPHLSYARSYTTLPQRMVDEIRRLAMQPVRPGPTAIAEEQSVTDLADELEIKSPSPYQVARVVARLDREDEQVRVARLGRKLEPLTLLGRSIIECRPGGVCEVDEGWTDLKGVALDGTEVTVTLRFGILICVATGDILAVVLSPKALDQWDYRRLLLRAILPKDALVERYGIQQPWETTAVPTVIRSDRGRIERCRLVLQAAADLPFVVELAPIRDAHAKPFVESFIGAFKRRFGHRLAISTGRSPEHRGANDPHANAVAMGIDVVELERLVMRHIVEVHRRTWSDRLRQKPASAWRNAVERFGCRTWLGTADEVRMLLKRDEGLRLVTEKGISYRGRWFGAGFLRPLLGCRVRIKVDEDDLRTIDVLSDRMVFQGVATNDELLAYDRPVSGWELDLAAQVDREAKKLVNGDALKSKHEITRDVIEKRDGDLARKTGRQAHQAARAEETQTAFVADLVSHTASSIPEPKEVTTTRPKRATTTYQPLIQPHQR